ncbi:MAG: TIGR03088 family PEP-CTERM/XrtA system glycosyltransferase [Betaproteobacteria bacterium]|nr:TIGR03088 family PEP-CTERM/XrtA system glycosyltransferase [Betaproteobacteria bacterium]
MAHIIYRLAIGGLENGVVNLINRLPASRFRHVVISLTDVTEFRQRIARADVEVHAMHKPPGNSIRTQWQVWRLLRRLRPDVVHTRNLAALECQAAAAFAGVKFRVHSEHGREFMDIHGTNSRHLFIRRAMRPFVHRYIALSEDLEQYLLERVGVSRTRLTRIYNGVDTARFGPREGEREPLPFEAPTGPDDIVFGSVGRMEPVKDPVNLAKAFVIACDRNEALGRRMRLVMVGDGSLRDEAIRIVREAGLSAQAWFPGSSNDVDRMLRALDVFVLPSLSEGISNTILEAMATGRPVIATRAGGNPELVLDSETGWLVPTGDPASLAACMTRYAGDRALARRHGERGRARALEHFSLDRMVQEYGAVYAGSGGASGGARRNLSEVI